MAPLLWLIYCNDLDEDLSGDVTRSLYADDTALLATGRSLQACADRLQPDLNRVARWLERWKVEASPNKCVFTTFSLDAKEVNGKVVPALTFKGAQLTHESHPTFLGLTLDRQLTFTKHIDEGKKRMSQRRRCLAALAGGSYGSNPPPPRYGRPTSRTSAVWPTTEPPSTPPTPHPPGGPGSRQNSTNAPG